MTLHLCLHVYCHSRSLGLFWLLSSGHWALWVLRSQFWTLDFASGFAQTQVECTFCVKVCEFSLCVCVGFVLCCLCLLLCGPQLGHSVSQSDGQSEAQLLKKPNSWHADHINLSSLCKISCMIWPLPAPAPGLAICITLWSELPICLDRLWVYSTIRVCVWM